MKEWIKKHSKTVRVFKICLIAVLFIGIIVLAADHMTASATYSKGDINMVKIIQSEQYKHGKFWNKVPWEWPSTGPNLSTIWKFLTGGEQRKPEVELPVRPVNISHFSSSGDNQLNVTWLGHSSLMINIDGYRVLTDPVFEKRVSIVGPTRYNGEVPLVVDELPDIDAVVVSHNHYDHLNKYSIQLLDHKTKRFIVPLAVGAQLEKWGISRTKIVELDWWEEYPLDTRLMIAATPSQHFSGRGLSDRDKTLWASFVIRGPRHQVFFSGDSGYFSGFKEIGDYYGPFDMTFLECGAYNERWHHIHMFPEETVKAHVDLKGKVLHPIHWGTFNLALHPWYEPMERLSDAASAAMVKTALPVVGETSIYGGYIPEQKWWEAALKKQGAPDNKKLVLEGVTTETN
jgi:L-ascorbate metabolism protein UlaG (beta-lactamase superfamily)